MSTKFNRWKELADALEPASRQALDETAKKGKGHVQDHIRGNGQVRTGFMLGSVYASTPEGSDYTSDEKALPEEKPSHKYEAVIGVAAHYAIFPNYGTVHQAAHPFFEPGMDETRADFDRAMQGIAKMLGDAAK